MADPTEQKHTQLANIERATGRTVAEWAELVDATALGKHGQTVAHLKGEYGLTHGNANALAHAVRDHASGGPSSGADMLDAQYAGAKARLRPIYAPRDYSSCGPL